MNDWLNSSTPPTRYELRVNQRSDRLLRATDLTFAVCVLFVLGIPMLLAALFATTEKQECKLPNGRSFVLTRWTFDDNGIGRVWRHLGAKCWLTVFHILRGDMAWVGPCPQWIRQKSDIACLVRPGLINLWTIRQRTAVDFHSEDDATLEYLRKRGLRHDLGLLAKGCFVALVTRTRDTHAIAPERINICDVFFDNVSMPEALARIRDMLDGQQVRQVSFVNPACVNIAAKDRGYRRALHRCDFVLPDGIGTKIAGDLLGTPIKQNVNGTDLFPRLCDLLQARQTKVFLLGGQVGVPERVAEVIRARWPGIQVVGYRDGFFSIAEEGDVAKQVRASGAEFLLVARGVPIQDVFIDRHLHNFGVKVAMGVGGLFDFVSGRIDRAPQWMRDIGMEWLYRLAQEPQRMWRRYLIGNVTFLARVLLQRAGLRVCADDISGKPAAPVVQQDALAMPPTIGQGGLQAILFATPVVDAQLPFGEDHPTALMPFGAESVIEHMMERLAEAGVAHVDLVVCDRPEAIRARVGDGRRWGISVHWHLAKDPSHPYDVLKGFEWRKEGRVLIGHTSALISARAALSLSNQDRIAIHFNAHELLSWSGWASMPTSLLIQLLGSHQLHPESLDWRALGLERVLLHDKECLSFTDAEGLLEAQTAAMHGRIPATWIQTPWGAHSPLSHIHPSAKITGPAFFGPGCYVGKHCEIGPYVNLTQDVIVEDRTSISHSIVMPQTHIGHNLNIDHAVIHGSAMSNVKLDVHTALSPRDAIMTSMSAGTHSHVNLTSRMAALFLLFAVSPALVLVWMRRRLLGRPALWVEQRVIKGFHPQQPHRMEFVTVRHAINHAPGWERLLSRLGPVLDIAQGRRQWFGIRPRIEADWLALRREWQSLLSNQPLGFIHEPAWTDEQVSHHEACAAADLFYVARQGWKEHTMMLRKSLWSPLSGASGHRTVEKPVWQRT